MILMITFMIMLKTRYVLSGWLPIRTGLLPDSRSGQYICTRMYDNNGDEEPNAALQHTRMS